MTELPRTLDHDILLQQPCSAITRQELDSFDAALSGRVGLSAAIVVQGQRDFDNADIVRYWRGLLFAEQSVCTVILTYCSQLIAEVLQTNTALNLSVCSTLQATSLLLSCSRYSMTSW